MRSARSVARFARCALTLCLCGVANCRSRSGETVGDAEHGREVIRTVGCGACHTIDGVQGARAAVGPPLDGIASRSIIAGRLPNTPANLLRWVVNPGSIQPGVAMPPLESRDPRDGRDVVAYLLTLR